MIQKTLLLCTLFLNWPLLGQSKEIEITSSWPQWRGPDRNGIIPSDSPWPAKIDQGSLKEKWRVKLGKGYSGPVVSNEMVYTTESLDEDEITHAYNRKDGELIWSAKWKGQMKVPFFAAKNGSWIRSTPTINILN